MEYLDYIPLMTYIDMNYPLNGNNLLNLKKLKNYRKKNRFNFYPNYKSIILYT